MRSETVVCGCPKVLIRTRRNSPYRQIDWDMDCMGEGLSNEACATLDFAWWHHARNVGTAKARYNPFIGLRPNQTPLPLGHPMRGAKIERSHVSGVADVLKEDAEWFAAYLLRFILDPANHDFDTHAENQKCRALMREADRRLFACSKRHSG